ncbi:MAG: OB-fold domain-containing protein [Hyphomonadaceae bacterium]|nr:OB-fold domain-containing protein [Hyphomonadaceae bacterium]
MDIQPDREFFAFLAQGKFMLQCARGGRPFFYPRVAEPGTGARDLAWVEASGLGAVYATTVVRSRPPQADYNVAVIELDEGPRMLSRVEDVAPDQVVIGMRVIAQIVPFEDHHTVIFRPVERAEGSGR